MQTEDFLNGTDVITQPNPIDILVNQIVLDILFAQADLFSSNTIEFITDISVSILLT